MAKVLALMSSARKKENTDCLVDQMLKGASEMGHECQKVCVSDLNIHPCIGCRSCNHNGNCVFKDDMVSLYQQLLEADVIVLASPVYFYTWNSQMKSVLDRTFAIENILKNKDFYLITTGLAPEEKYFDIMIESFKKYVQCFRAGGNQIVDYVLGMKTGNKEDVEKSEAMNQAYLMGKNIKDRW